MDKNLSAGAYLVLPHQRRAPTPLFRHGDGARAVERALRMLFCRKPTIKIVLQRQQQEQREASVLKRFNTGEVGSINYWLPSTEFVVVAVRRDVVTAGPTGSRLAAVLDATVVQAVAADHKSAVRTLAITAQVAETVEVEVTLSDQGVVTALNSKSRRSTTRRSSTLQARP
jgi:hypothetical protein